VVLTAASRRGVEAQSASPNSVVMPAGKPIQIKVPLGLPTVPIPEDNPPTEETIALGRRLYYEAGKASY
jgi:hypothetical protein